MSGYRASHRALTQVEAYDREFNTPGTPDEVLWQLERRLLPGVLADLPSPRQALDFATGTGRIAHLLEEVLPGTAVTGVDVSPEMLERARARCQRVKLVEGDITRDDTLLPGAYDLVTAFRFFLRAEPALRLEALRAAHRRLAPTGRLVANFHRNPRSLRGIWLRLRPDTRALPFLARREVEALLDAGGFEVERVLGYQHCWYRSHPRGPVRQRPRLDAALAGSGPLAGLGASMLVVARPRRAGGAIEEER